MRSAARAMSAELGVPFNDIMVEEGMGVLEAMDADDAVQLTAWLPGTDTVLATALAFAPLQLRADVPGLSGHERG